MSRKAPKSERLELALAINSITTKQDAFVKAVEVLDKYKTEILQNLDMEIEAKKIELQDLDADYTRMKKSGKIETEQYIQEFKYQGAIDILENHKQIAISSEVFEKMQDQIQNLEDGQQGEIEKIKKEEAAKAKIAINSALQNSNLQHRADIAELTAVTNQQKKEIITLQSTIDNLKIELAAQRELTKDVALAGRAAPITQNLSK